MIEKIQPVVGAYSARPIEFRPYDPRSAEIAQRVVSQLAFHAPKLRLEHVGSTAVSLCAGSGTIDLLAATAAAELADLEGQLTQLGFEPISTADSFFAEAKLFGGSIAQDDQTWTLHVCLVAADHAIIDSLRFLRSCLRSDPDLRKAYVEQKRTSLAKGADSAQYARAKSEFLKMILG